MSEDSAKPIELSTGPDLLRFQLFDLVCAVTWMAVLFALLGPFIHFLSAVAVAELVVGIGGQVGSFVGVLLYFKSRRAQALEQAGRFLEFTEEEPLNLRAVRLLLAMGILASLMFAQIVVALCLSPIRAFRWFTILVTAYVPGFFAAYYFKLWLGHGRQRLEFFENGIVLFARQFVPWSLIEAQSHPSQRQRITLVVKFPHKSPEFRSYEADVSDQFKSWLHQRGLLS